MRRRGMRTRTQAEHDEIVAHVVAFGRRLARDDRYLEPASDEPDIPEAEPPASGPAPEPEGGK